MAGWCHHVVGERTVPDCGVHPLPILSLAGNKYKVSQAVNFRTYVCTPLVVFP